MIAFKNNDMNQIQDHLFFGFYCDSRMNYYDHVYESLHVKNGSKDSIYYGIHDRSGGTVCEIKMVWYELNRKIVPRLEIFSENFDYLTKGWHLEVLRGIKLLEKELFTPEEFSRILINLGFEDLSDDKLPVDK